MENEDDDLKELLEKSLNLVYDARIVDLEDKHATRELMVDITKFVYDLTGRVVFLLQTSSPKDNQTS